MTESELVEAIHRGIHKATSNFCVWSDGLFLSEGAMEGFMVTYMAQEIMALGNHPPYLRLEHPVEELKATSGRSHRGRPSARTSGLARIDMTVLNAKYQLRFAIEAKCTYAWAETYNHDMERLIKILREFSKKHAETAMQAAIFAMFVHSYGQGRTRAEYNIEKKMEKWEEWLEEYSKNDIIVSCNRSPLAHYEYETEDGEVHLASSLCAVIKTA